MRFSGNLILCILFVFLCTSLTFATTASYKGRSNPEIRFHCEGELEIDKKCNIYLFIISPGTTINVKLIEPNDFTLISGEEKTIEFTYKWESIKYQIIPKSNKKIGVSFILTVLKKGKHSKDIKNNEIHETLVLDMENQNAYLTIPDKVTYCFNNLSNKINIINEDKEIDIVNSTLKSAVKLIKENQYQDALKLLKNSEEKKDESYYFVLGKAYFLSGRTWNKDALKAFQKAPGINASYKYIAELHLRDRNYKECIKYYKIVIDKYGDISSIYNKIGPQKQARNPRALTIDLLKKI